MTDKRGERGHYVRVNIMMPPEMLRRLKEIGAQLQSLGHKNTDVSSTVRFAIGKILPDLESDVLIEQLSK